MQLFTRSRLVIAGTVVVVLTVLTAGIAAASFDTTRYASQPVAAASIPPANTPSATVAGSTVTLTFAPITLTGGRSLDGYQALRSGTTVPVACAASGCQITNVPDGTWTFSVRGLYDNWIGAYGAASNSAAVVTVTPLTVTVTVREQNANQGRARFSGTGSSGSTSIVISVYSAATCTGGTGAVLTFADPGTGNWGPTPETGNLADNRTWYAKAVQGANASPCTSFTIPNY